MSLSHDAIIFGLSLLNGPPCVAFFRRGRRGNGNYAAGEGCLR